MAHSSPGTGTEAVGATVIIPAWPNGSHNNEKLGKECLKRGPLFVHSTTRFLSIRDICNSTTISIARQMLLIFCTRLVRRLGILNTRNSSQRYATFARFCDRNDIFEQWAYVQVLIVFRREHRLTDVRRSSRINTLLLGHK